MSSEWVRACALVVVGGALGGCTVQGPAPDDDTAASEPVIDQDRPDDATALPIINGSEASDYPEAVLVNMYTGSWQTSSCSGSLIAPRVVLTAGHCVHGIDKWKIVAPYAAPKQQAWGTVSAVYDWNNDGEYVDPNQHDVGLVILDTPIAIDHYLTVASQKVAYGTEVLNIGRIDDGTMSNSKLFVSQPVAVYNGSSVGFPFDYYSSEVIQSGDSGGPVVLPGSAPRTVVAVNSGAGGGTQVLARVDLLAAWLSEQIAATEGGSDSGGESPPPPSSCAHAICAQGDKLDASCDACASQICTQDPYCCGTAWDNVCVQEVASICGQSCG